MFFRFWTQAVKTLVLVLCLYPALVYSEVIEPVDAGSMEQFCTDKGIPPARCRKIAEALIQTKGSAEKVRKAMEDIPELNGLSAEEAFGLTQAIEKDAQSRSFMKKERQKDKAAAKNRRAAEQVIQKTAEGEQSLFERYLNPGLNVETGLKPFGYEFFKENPDSHPQDLPVAQDYIVGPGDEISVLVWGRVSGQYDMQVSREGTVQFPNIGELTVGGLTYQELKQYLRRKASGIIGAEISVTMGKLRSVQVFVLGEVKKPGPYMLSAMSTVASALIAAGGPGGTGSLRKVELKRAGRTVSTIDFYDLLLYGDKSKDSRVSNGDVIFVPTVGPLAGVAGNVRRPAIYELKANEDAGSVIELAGGMTPAAYTLRVQVERLARDKGRISIDIENNGLKKFGIQDGDMVKIFPLVEKDLNAVYLEGNVKRPGTYELKEGMRVRDILTGEDDLLKGAYLGYALIKRVQKTSGEVKFIAFSLDGLFEGDKKDNIPLQVQDTITVFSNWAFRDRPFVTIEGEVRCKSVLQEVMKAGQTGSKKVENRDRTSEEKGYEKDESGENQAEESIQSEGIKKGAISNDIGKPGDRASGTELRADMPQKKDREMEPGDRINEITAPEAPSKSVKSCSFIIPESIRIKDLILMAGGLTREASRGEFELYRTDPVTREVVLHRHSLGKALDEDTESNMLLTDQDRVVIHSMNEVEPKKTVSITGEVGRPGEYPYTINMRVSDLVFASGNLLESAYIETAELADAVVSKGEGFRTDYVEIDLRKALQGDPRYDLALKPGSTLFVKKIPGWNDNAHVTLQGEVLFPGRYLVKKGERLSSLIERAGGYKENAYLKGAVFTRESVRKMQQKNIEESVNRLEYSLLKNSISNMEKTVTPEGVNMLQASMEQKKTLISKMRSARASGRMSIRLDRAEKIAGTNNDLVLEDGDTLIIPERPTQVQIVGSVYNQTAFLYDPDWSVSYYLKMSGGLTKSADQSEIYILKADGTAVKDAGGPTLGWDQRARQWMGGIKAARLDPGDTIVVPEKVDNIAWLKETKDLTQILYQIAVTAGVLIVAF